MFKRINLNGKTALVTGAGKGLGKACAIALAEAGAKVFMKSETLDLIISGSHKKGDVLAVARVAGIQAAKKCSELWQCF